MLEAAGQVFAQVGYKDATIREIVKRAGASLGAVNYHFRDKAGLYRAVLAYAHESTIAEFQAALNQSDPEQRLLQFVRAGLADVLVDDPGRAWTGQVLAAELTRMGDRDDRDLYGRVIAPRQALLFSIVRSLMGPDAADDTIKRHALSIVGQCALYYTGRPAVEKTYGRRIGRADLDWLSRHITNVALAGMRAEGAEKD